MVARDVALTTFASLLLHISPHAHFRTHCSRGSHPRGGPRALMESDTSDGSRNATLHRCHFSDESFVESATQKNMSRHDFMTTIRIVALSMLNAPYRALASVWSNPKRITLPLASNGAAFETEFFVGNQQFSAVVDTGSPFLLVSGLSKLSRNSYGSDDGSALLGDSSVVEFAGQSVDVEWRRGSVRLAGNRKQSATFDPINFGVVRRVEGKDRGALAVYLGLAKERRADSLAKPKEEVGDARIRPTFLEQIDAASMELNFIDHSFTLAWKPLLSSQSDAIPLIDVRQFGAPLAFYSFKVHRLYANGKEIVLPRPCIATIDTGLTGMLVSDSFCVDCLPGLRDWRAVRSVQVETLTEKGRVVSFKASDATSNYPLLIFEESLDWKGKVFNDDYDEKPDFIFLGLSFLDKLRLKIDMDDWRLGSIMT